MPRAALDRLVLDNLAEIHGTGGWARVSLTEKGLARLQPDRACEQAQESG